MRKFVPVIMGFIIVLGLLCVCQAETKGNGLTKEEAEALEETLQKTYTYDEVQAAALATMCYPEGRDYPVHVPLVVEIKDDGSDSFWFGGKYGYQGKITIRIYEDHPDHIATRAYYHVDCSTWKGTIEPLQEEVDLRGALAGLAISPGWTK